MLSIPPQLNLSVFRDFLLKSGYDATHLGDELGLSHGLYGNLGNLEPLLERTSGDAALPVLARLFFVGWPTRDELCRKHIPDDILRLCMEAGVLVLEDGNVSPNVVITPFEDSSLVCFRCPPLPWDKPKRRRRAERDH